MYQNIYYDYKTNTMHLWDDEQGYKSFRYNRKAYIPTDDMDSKYISMYGDRLDEIILKKGTQGNDEIKLFGSDLKPENQVLIDLYLDLDTNVLAKHKVVCFDIEVDTTYTFPKPEDANNTIISVAKFDYVTNKHTCYVLDPTGTLSDEDGYQTLNDKQYAASIRIFDNEVDLMAAFINELDATILTGWFIDEFDIPYIINRLYKIAPELVPLLSPIKKVEYKEYQKKYVIAGISVLDYLSLYKKFTFSQEPSYRLDYIAKKELGVGKVEYEGRLSDLYRTDIKKFIKYNITDNQRVVDIDKKVKFIDNTIAIAQKGKIPYEDIHSSSRYIDGAIISYLKKKNIIVTNKPEKDFSASTDKFEGALVKMPMVGLFEWIYDLDLTSLYPSIIMTLNISPETKLMKIENWDHVKYASGESHIWNVYHFVKQKSALIPNNTLKELFLSKGYHISTNGIVYENKNVRKGIIPEILEVWFTERIKYKNLMKKFAKEGNAEMYDFYDKLQYVQKVLLNTVYGVLGMRGFRFYDLDNAVAVTKTGQHIIMWSQLKGNEYKNIKLKTIDKDYCIYSDTDSAFFTAADFVKGLSEEEALQKVMKVSDATQKYINDSYNEFCLEYMNTSTHRIEIKKELICRRGFWEGTKKRYGLKVIIREGIPEEKYIFKGIEIVKSSFPPAFKTALELAARSILDGVDKKDVDKIILDLEDGIEGYEAKTLAKVTSITDIKKYCKNPNARNIYYKSILSNINKGTPAHVRASIYYNNLMDHFGITNIPHIGNDEKVKWVYLKDNPLKLQNLAFRGYDDPQEILDFIETFCDKQRMYESEMKTKVVSIYHALGWRLPNKNSEQLESFFKFD
jgi:DNA polymerase elongation subunit (family B)